MKVILVDDELLALEYMEKLIHKIGGITVTGKYINSLDALEAVKTETPDVIFLDVEMPGINGIELATRIQEFLPKAHIIFVTAFSEYAVKAFDLNAIDYLVKPVRLARLEQAFQRVPSIAAPPIKSVRSVIKIKTAQRLSFVKTEGLSEMEMPAKWRTSKVRSIFAFLLLQHGKPVRKEALIQQFWPDLSDEKAYIQLYSAIYQIRKTLSSLEDLDISITTSENSYQLTLNGAALDVDDWEKELKQLPVLDSETLLLHQRAADSYDGDYLAEENYSWAEAERERLNILWSQHISRLAKFLSDHGKISEAISLYLRIQTTSPYIEDSYLQLMRLYQELKNYHAVEQQYTMLKQMLREEFGIEPDPSIRAWYWASLK